MRLYFLPPQPSATMNLAQAKTSYLAAAWLFGIALFLMTVLWFQNGVILG